LCQRREKYVKEGLSCLSVEKVENRVVTCVHDADVVGCQEPWKLYYEEEKKRSRERTAVRRESTLFFGCTHTPESIVSWKKRKEKKGAGHLKS